MTTSRSEPNGPTAFRRVFLPQFGCDFERLLLWFEDYPWTISFEEGVRILDDRSLFIQGEQQGA